MRKMFGFTVAVLLILALAATGTFAYFTDTETSEDNTISMGTLDLKINNADIPYTILSVTDKKPGDSGSGSTTLKNAGSLTGELDIASSVVANTPGGGGTEYEGGSGELGGVALLAVYLDVDQSGGWNAGDIGLKSDETTYVFPTALNYATIDSYSNKNWGGTSGVEQMLANATDDVFLLWQVPTGGTNTIQGDSVSIGFSFVLEQPEVD